MSYDIDYNRLAISFDLSKAYQALKSRYDINPDQGMFWEHDYRRITLVMAEMGNNRCFDIDNKVAREWVTLNLSTDPILEIIGFARDVERGHIRLQGRHTQAEGYIRTYRQLIDDAVPSFWLLNGEIPDGLTFNLPEAAGDIKTRWMSHPHTRSLLDYGALRQDAKNGRWQLNVEFLDETRQLLSVAWYFAVFGDQSRPWLQRRVFDRHLSRIANARKHGVYTTKKAS